MRVPVIEDRNHFIEVQVVFVYDAVDTVVVLSQALWFEIIVVRGGNGLHILVHYEVVDRP